MRYVVFKYAVIQLLGPKYFVVIIELGMRKILSLYKGLYNFIIFTEGSHCICPPV